MLSTVYPRARENVMWMMTHPPPAHFQECLRHNIIDYELRLLTWVGGGGCE